MGTNSLIDALNQKSLEEIIESYGGREADPMELYSWMFWLGDGLIETSAEARSGRTTFKGNPIIVGSFGGRIRRRVMFEDTFEKTLAKFQDYDWAILSGCTYFGKANTAANQSKLCALIFDFDGVTPASLDTFLNSCYDWIGLYPWPNYIALSGHGIHLYYLFEQPVSLYPNIKYQIKNLKYALTDQMWNRHTSTDPNVQHQGINQGFRIIGGKTKIPGKRVRLFNMFTSPYWFEKLNEFIPENFHVDGSKLWKDSEISLEEAKNRYPEWYERRVVQGQARGSWTTNRGLYDWWLKKISDSATGVTKGHRYFCIMALAIYAIKSGISHEQLKRDAYALIPAMTQINENEPFTQADVDSALECYDERYKLFPRQDIEKITAIRIDPARRRTTPLKRDDGTALKAARFLQDLSDPSREWRNKNGAPTKREVILDYAAAHPEANHSEIARALGVSRSTVIKWLSSITG